MNNNNWKIIGHIFRPESNFEWSLSHAQVPFTFRLNENTIRIFYATRDKESCSAVSFIDVLAEEPSNILYIHDKPCLSKGKKGYFDDSGTMPSWFIEHEGKIYLYYTAWNKSKEASYRLSIGLAISEDNGISFKKRFDGPIMDRSIYDPIWVAQPCVIKEKGGWKMWYLSCKKVEIINNHPEPFYTVDYATSTDGINWERYGTTCIDLDSSLGQDAIGRPFVFKEGNVYWMFHSNRSAHGYRQQSDRAYKICLSSSTDGIHWSSKTDNVFDQVQPWCSIMQEYASYYIHGNDEFLVFNGDGFGETGFGFAKKTL